MLDQRDPEHVGLDLLYRRKMHRQENPHVEVPLSILHNSQIVTGLLFDKESLRSYIETVD